MNNLNDPIVVEQTFNASNSQVWNAITRLEEMRQWYFNNIPAFEPVVGFETEFGVQSEGRNFQHRWKIMESDTHKRIKYRWKFNEYEGESFVTFQLFEKNEQTVLRVTNEGLETFPQNIPEFTRESCQAGWEFFIKKSLKDYLDAKSDQA